MKPLVIIAVFFSTYCLGQSCTKEDFLSDILSGTSYYSGNDTNHGLILMSQYCKSPSLNENNFHGELPDSSFNQMKDAIIKDSSYMWDTNAIHKLVSKKVCFPSHNDLDLIMDYHTKWDTGGSMGHKDSIAKRLKLIKQTLVEYHYPTGYYVFKRPVFDKWCTYAIFYHEYFCNYGMLCGDGSYDLYKKENGHWEQVTTGTIIEY